MLLTCLSIPAQKKGIDEKILVVYFSHSGNTRTVAEQITRSTGADLFEIQPQEAYPTDYHSVVNQAKKEINTNHRPALKNDVQDFDKYDIIFIGSPNWWSTIAPPVATFLERHDFSGKTIVPFMTHGGGRFGILFRHEEIMPRCIFLRRFGNQRQLCKRQSSRRS